MDCIAFGFAAEHGFIERPQSQDILGDIADIRELNAHVLPPTIQNPSKGAFLPMASFLLGQSQFLHGVYSSFGGRRSLGCNCWAAKQHECARQQQP
jgi:hypothetical protein